MEITLPENPRILVTRADRMGDLILSTPVFSEIKKNFPKAHLAALSFLENREILEGNPFLDEIILYDKSGSEKSFFGNFRFSRKLAKKKFDLAVHLHATNRMHQLAWLAGIPVRIGWDRRAAWALTRSFPDVKKQGARHEAEYNFDLLDPLGMKVPQDLEPFFPVSDRAEASFEMLCRHLEIPKSKPWIVLAPGASCPSKKWPAERFAYVAQALSKKQDFIFLGIGASQDSELNLRIQQNTSAPFYDLSGKLSLGMLGTLLKRSALLITNDSGPAHVASAVKTPVISIFGRNQPGLSPRRWRPLGNSSVSIWKNVGCDPCLAHDCQIHFLCLDVISAGEVLAEAERILQFKGGEVCPR